MNRVVRTLALALALALALVVVPTVAADAPATNMIHVVDASYIPERTEIAPGGLVTVMSFPDRDGTPRAHSVTSDDGRAFDVRLAVATNESGYEQANFTAPRAPGEYAFHDVETSARGVLVVIGPPPAATTKAVPWPPLALALALALAFKRPKD